MEKKMNDFAIFILSHGRPNTVFSYKTLRRQGYTGKIYIIIDNADTTANQYYKNYDKQVIMFNKKEEAKYTDCCDNFNNLKTAMYARNVCYKIAKKLNIRYFCQFDDDYTQMEYKSDNLGNYSSKCIKNLDKIFKIILDFYKSVNIKSIAFAQGGDFLGGSNNSEVLDGYKPIRKCMNSWICDTERPLLFTGTMNDDVSTYVRYSIKGYIFLTCMLISVIQVATQAGEGGMSDIYKNSGTYVKTFYTVMQAPSCVKIALMGRVNYRIHHKVQWNNTAPKIIREKYKK
jgi:hypothetical protein